MRHFALAGGFAAFMLAVSPAAAWTPPSVGAPCASARPGKVDGTAIAGNYLGGRAMRAGIVDWKSFQGCFRDIAACEDWLAQRAMSHPLRPGFARCTPVTIGRRA